MSTYQPAQEVDHPDNLPGLVRHLAEQFATLIRMEVRLVKAETREGVKKVAISGVLAWVAINFVFLFLLFLAVGITFALVQMAGMTLFGASFVTALICLVLVGVCLGVALWRLKKDEPHLA